MILILVSAPTLVSYFFANWFVSFDCLRTESERAVKFCAQVESYRWITTSTRLQILKRLSWAQVEQKSYNEALQTFEKMAALAPLGFGELKNRYVALYFTQRVQEAQVDLETALAIRPKDETLVFDYSNIAQELGHPEKAKPFLEALLTDNEKNIGAINALGELEYRLENMDRTKELAQKALEIDTYNAQAHNLLALALEKEGRKSDALNHYTLAIEQDKDNAVYLSNRALLQYDLENFRAAREDFKLSLSKHRTFDNVLGLALVELEEVDVTPAKALIEEALRMNSNSYAAHVAMGRFAYYKDDYVTARQHLKEAASLPGDPSSAQYWLAKVDAVESKPELALPVFERLQSVWPENPSLQSEIGLVLLALERPLDALKAFKRCSEMDRRNYFCWDNLARTYIRLDNPVQAIEAASQAISQDKAYSYAYVRRAYAQWQLGRVNEARLDYDMAMGLEPKSTWIAEERAEFLIFAGNEGEGAEAVAALGQRGSTKPMVLKMRGRLAESTGDYAGAAKLYEEASREPPFDPYLLEDLAWALLYDDKLLEGLEACGKMLVLAPKNSQAQRCRSAAYRTMQNWEYALEADNLAISLAPDAPAAYVDKVYDLLMLKRNEDALDTLNLLLHKNYETALVYYYRAQALLEQRQPEQALKSLRNGLDIAHGRLAVDISAEINRLQAKTFGRFDFEQLPYPQQRSRGTAYQ